MYEQIIKIINLDIEQANDYFKFFSKKLPIEQEEILAMKQKLYNNFDDEEDKKKLAQLKKNPAKYERAILIGAIASYRNMKKSEKLKAAIKNERLKNRVKRPAFLENKIRSIFSEVAVYRKEGATFVDICNILKKKHRTKFNNFKLTPSYLRRIILKIESENATAK
jgi:hypothetical protein